MKKENDKKKISCKRCKGVFYIKEEPSLNIRIKIMRKHLDFWLCPKCAKKFETLAENFFRG